MRREVCSLAGKVERMVGLVELLQDRHRYLGEGEVRRITDNIMAGVLEQCKVRSLGSNEIGHRIGVLSGNY